MPFPWLAAAMAAAGAMQAGSSSISNKNKLKSEEKLARDEMALKESTLNPHRNQLQQLRSLISLNAARTMPRSAAPLGPAGKYARPAAQVGGASSMDMPLSYGALDPDLVRASEMLEGDVLAGQEAPTFSGKNKKFSLDLATRMGRPARRGRATPRDAMSHVGARMRSLLG